MDGRLKNELEEHLAQLGLNLSLGSVRPDEIICWRDSREYARFHTPISSTFGVRELSHVLDVRVCHLLMLPRVSESGTLELMFKRHDAWKYVLPVMQPRTAAEADAIAAARETVPFADLSGVSEIGGLLSFKRSATHGSPSAWIFRLFVVRGSVRASNAKTFSAGEREYAFLSKGELEAASEAEWPNLDVYRAIEILFPAKWAGIRPFGRQFDFAISFAGPDRPIAEAIARSLVRRRTPRRLAVFYDAFAELAGEHLPTHLTEVYANRAHFAVPLVSKNYESIWARHELKSLLGRAIREPGKYVIPVQLDGTQVSTLRDLSSISLNASSGPQGVADRLVRTLKAAGLA